MKNSILAFIFLCVATFPSLSHAQVPFGGLDVFEFPCTCSPFMFTLFAPLFTGPIPGAGALAVPDTPTMFPFFVLFPTAWALGTYTPGVQACWMFPAVGPCFPVLTLGVMDPFTGTSL
jgi:hypothetical protein